MRCDQCNKFASYDDSTDPEVDVDLSDDGSFSGQVRIVLTCADCGQELKESTFDFDGEVPEEILAEHKGDEHSLSFEAGDNELLTRSEGKGRYTKTFYGYRAGLDLSCTCQSEGLWSTEFTDDVQASHMDELV
jgi:hypothetical protein